MVGAKSSNRPWLQDRETSQGVEPSFHNSEDSLAQFEKDVREIMQELGDLLIRKQRDYGPKNISNSPYGAVPGLIVRMYDKIARIVNLTNNKVKPSNEPLEDSFKDLANYGVIGLLVLRNKWDK
jgi:hypothetical protein